MSLTPDLKNQVGLAPATGAKLSVDADTGASALGGAIAKFGTTLGIAAETEYGIEDMYNRAGVRDVAAEATAALAANERDLYGTKAKGTQEMYPTYEGRVQTIREEARSKLTNDSQRSMFDAVWQEQEYASKARAAKYRDDQVKTYALDSAGASISAHTDAAIDAYASGDTVAAARHRLTIAAEYAVIGHLQGWGKEEQEDKTSAHLSKMDVAIVRSLDGRPLDQLAYMDQHSKNIRPEDEIPLRTSLAPAVEAAVAQDVLAPVLDSLFAGAGLPEGAPGASANTSVPQGDAADAAGEYKGASGAAPSTPARTPAPAAAARTTGTAGKLGDNTEVKAAIRGPESSGNDFAVNGMGSSAAGRYQFTKDTWISHYSRVYGVPRSTAAAKWGDGRTKFDPAVQERLVDADIDDNRKALRGIGQPETVGNLYVMHVLGAPTGTKFLQAAPDTPVAAILPASVIRGNPTYFGGGKTVGQARQAMDAKLGSPGAAGSPAVPARVTKFTENPEYARKTADPTRGLGRRNQPGQAYGAPRDGGARAHKGEDYGMDLGEPVFSPRPGTVTKVQTAPNGGTGRFVWVDHGNGVVTKYFHFASVNVKVGDTVNETTKLGGAGGSADGKETAHSPHLHYEVWVDGKATDPAAFDWSGYDVKGYNAGGASAPGSSMTTFTPGTPGSRPSDAQLRAEVDKVADYEEWTPRQREAGYAYVTKRAAEYDAGVAADEKKRSDTAWAALNKLEAEGGVLTDPVVQLGDAYLFAPPHTQLQMRDRGKANIQRQEDQAARQAEVDAANARALAEGATAAAKEDAQFNARTRIFNAKSSDDPIVRANYYGVGPNPMRPSDYVGILPEAEITAWQKDQAEGAQKGAAGNPLIVKMPEASGVLGYVFTRPKTYSDAEWGNLSIEFAQELQYKQEQAGRKFTEQEKMQAGRDFVFRKHYVWQEGGMFTSAGYDTSRTYTTGALLDTPVDEDEVTVTFYNNYKKNHPGATDAQVREAWRRTPRR